MKTFDFNKETGQISIDGVIFSPGDTVDRVKKLLLSLEISCKENGDKDFYSIFPEEEIGLEKLIFHLRFLFSRKRLTHIAMWLVNTTPSPGDYSEEDGDAIRFDKTRISKLFVKRYALSNMRKTGDSSRPNDRNTANFDWGSLDVFMETERGWCSGLCITYESPQTPPKHKRLRYNVALE